MSGQWERYDVVVATFKPRALATLKPEAVDWIGWRGRWINAWLITDEDGAPYVGQDAWSPFVEAVDAPTTIPFCWVPTEDLFDIAPLRRRPLRVIRSGSP